MPLQRKTENIMMSETALLRACVDHLGAHLDDADREGLHAFGQRDETRARPLAGELLSLPVVDWDARIDAHRAHRHSFYRSLAADVTVREYATFLLENWAYPPFLALVEKTLAVQITERGKEAVRANIADEHVPAPHADLMRRLFLAVKARAGADVPVDVYPSLVERTLVFYYGYYVEPWHLVGSLYATERLAHYRLLEMGRGLERLGFRGDDLEFIRVHLACDDDHARDWRDHVIGASVEAQPSVSAAIAAGIASCLETSALYLDDLERRVRTARTCPDDSIATPERRASV
jgi:pyrroloquinoline quinone (PQQ) biosynthesis protein C